MDQQTPGISNVYDLLETHNPEDLAYMLMKLFQEKKHFVPGNWELLNLLVDHDGVSEESAQQLLCLKVLHLMDRIKVDLTSCDAALALLDRLSDPTYRLTCLTQTYFQLVLLKADLLGSQAKYQSAFEYVKEIYDSHTTDVEFNQLNEAEMIKYNLKLKMAILSHLADLDGDFSYQLFGETLFKDQTFSKLTPSNCNVFIICGYECFRVGKHKEAMQIFEKVYLCIKEYQNTFSCSEMRKDLEQEAIAMRLIAKKALKQVVTKEEFQFFCNMFSETDNMSDKNKKLRDHVVELVVPDLVAGKSLVVTPITPITPMYQSTKQKVKGIQLNNADTSFSKPLTNGGFIKFG